MNRPLTNRQRQVAQRISDGESNMVIAGAMGISVPTVKHHVSQALCKLNLSNRVQLALWALQNPPEIAP